jgi:hypothetical protein
MDNMGLVKAMQEKQREMSRLRQMMGFLVENAAFPSVAILSKRRQASNEN